MRFIYKHTITHYLRHIGTFVTMITRTTLILIVGSVLLASSGTNAKLEPVEELLAEKRVTHLLSSILSALDDPQPIVISQCYGDGFAESIINNVLHLCGSTFQNPLVYNRPPSLQDETAGVKGVVHKVKVCIVFKINITYDLPPRELFYYTQQQFWDHNAYLVIVFQHKASIKTARALATALEYYKMLGLYRILFLAVELRTETLTLYTVNPFTKHVQLLGEDEANLSHFYPEYLSDLQGFQYRIVSISIDPLYIAGKLYGPEVNLMQDIVRYQNATYTLLIEQNRTDRFIERGLGDLSLSKSFLVGSSLRQHHAIPTHGGICVHIPAGDVIGLIHFFVKPFHLDVWMCVVASVAVIILCKAIFRGRISLNVGFFFGESSGNWARFSGYDRVLIVMLGLLILFCQTLYESQILSLIALRLYEKRIDTVAELFASDFQLIALPMVRKFVVAIFPEIEHRLPVHEHLPYGINTDRVQNAERRTTLVPCSFRVFATVRNNPMDKQYYIMRDAFIPMLEFFTFNPHTILELKYRTYRQYLIEGGFFNYYTSWYEQLVQKVKHQQTSHLEAEVLKTETLEAIFLLYLYGVAGSTIVFLLEIVLTLFSLIQRKFFGK
uniref:Uncharacterized protein n=1 Tax=Anopheles coluzzii TaxID=1518534 RepID=A0A6E8W9E1_ANOCL